MWLKLIIFIASNTSGGIMSIVWKTFSNGSISSFLPSEISVFVFGGLKKGDEVWGRCCDAVPAIASASSLIGLLESEFCLCGVCSTNGKMFSCEIWVTLFCGRVNCCDAGSFWVWNRPVRYSGILLCGALCPLTMWWMDVLCPATLWWMGALWS